MEDREIVERLFLREESALSHLSALYDRTLYAVAYRILESAEDAKECVNDTYLRVWEAIPPHRPLYLKAFLCKIARNLALGRVQRAAAQKRGGTLWELKEELLQDLPQTACMEDEIALKNAVDGFLSGLPVKKRTVFMQRYWYFLPVKEIALKNGMSESAVKVSLMRTRTDFKEYLKKEGIIF